jgi:hypothetical protein
LEQYGGVKTTACIEWNAEASDVEAKIEALTNVDSVRVVRSGSGDILSSYGYVYTVYFDGNAMHKATHDVDDVTALTGTATTVTTSADMVMSQDISAEGVIVGDILKIAGSPQASDEYKVMGISADGLTVTLHMPWSPAGGAGSAVTKIVRVAGLLSVDSAAGCSVFRNNVNGVLTNMAAADHGVGVVNLRDVDDAGMDLVAPYGGNRPNELTKQLALLPMVSSVTGASSGFSDSNGMSITVTFNDGDGDLPQMVCNVDAAFAAVSGATCGTNTVADGNVLSGFFTLGTSGSISHDASAADVKTAIEAMAGVTTVDVSRVLSDNRGGFVWSVTFTGDLGDISDTILAPQSSLVARDAAVTVTELTKGNTLGGTFTLSYNGDVSDALAFDISAADLDAKLEAIPGVGTVSVSKGGLNSEGGAKYLVTFQSATLGDALDLVADTSFLTGVGGAVSVREEVKGTLAVGDSVSISYTAPLPCSASQVPGSSCGSSVTEFVVELDSSNTFISNPQTFSMIPDYNVQTIRTSSGTASGRDFQNPGVGGYFTLSYEGAVTGIVSSAATTSEVRHALEGLPGINTVSVDKTFSSEKLAASICVDVIAGSTTVACNAACTCDFAAAGVQGNDLIKIGDGWYRVASSYLSGDTFQLATEADSTIPKSYTGSSDLAAGEVSVWSAGYEWTVTFHSVTAAGGMASPLGSPAHSLEPADAGVEIRLQDCNSCLYVSSLTTWSSYYLRGYTRNAVGTSPYTDAPVLSGGLAQVVSVVPRAIPDEPTSVSLNVISGNCIQVVFSPPANDPNNDVVSYTVDWDSDATFVNANLPAADCAQSGYGSCVITSAVTIDGTPPYTYDVCSLTGGTTFFFRVAASNSVAVQNTDPTGAIPDNTNWSATLDAIPVDQVPDAPDAVTGTKLSSTSVRLTISPPSNDGGPAVTNYIVEYDTSTSFATAGLVTATYSATPGVDFFSLNAAGDLVREFTGLTEGAAIYFRVAAINSVGTGATRTSLSVAPQGSPGAVASGSLSAITSSSSPIDTVSVAWTAPASNGGSPVDYYRVEWFTDDFTPEVQVVSLTWGATPSSATATTFKLTYIVSTASPGGGVATSALPYDVSANNMRDALLNLGYAASPNDNHLLDDVMVSRSTINNGAGYAWSITFGSSPDKTMNKGNLIQMKGEMVANEAGSSAVGVTTYTDGVTNMNGVTNNNLLGFGGMDEVQIVEVHGTNNGGAGGAGNTGVAGWFRLQFEGSSWTEYIAGDASAADVQTALAQLNTVGGSVAVTKVTDGGGTVATRSHYYKVTFASNTGDQNALTFDTSLLTSTATDASVVVYDGDNSVDVAGVLKASDAIVGETPTGYTSAIVSASTLSYDITGLTTGTEINVFVSARNAGHGYGPRLSLGAKAPPLQVPGSPVSVTSAVNPGMSDSLLIGYGAPASDGGSDVVRYLVELDTDSGFSSPIKEFFECPNNNKRTVWEIVQTVDQTTGSGSLSLADAAAQGVNMDARAAADSTHVEGGGYFALTVTANGVSETTAPIPYNAVALAQNETGTDRVLSVKMGVVDGSNRVTCFATTTCDDILFNGDVVSFGAFMTNSGDSYEVDYVGDTWFNMTAAFSGTDSTNDDHVVTIAGNVVSAGADMQNPAVGSDTLTMVSDASAELTVGDFVKIAGGGSVYADREYRVQAINGAGTTVTLNAHFDGTTANGVVITRMSRRSDSTSPATVTVHDGGRGSTASSKVHCTDDVGYASMCSAAREQQAGSMQSKIQDLTNVVTAGVHVDRDGPNQYGGFTWRITFLDDAPAGASDYAVTLADDKTFCKLPGVCAITVAGTPLVDGETFTQCVGPLQVPSAGGLITGSEYYTRVTAVSAEGYSLPQTAATVGAPSVVSGAPTGVTVEVKSSTELKVLYSAPSNNGGNTITSYTVEYATQSDFSDAQTITNSLLSGGAPFHTSISGLTKGTFYFVRVSASNVNGAGPTQASTPASLNPHATPSAPVSVVTSVTSNSMLTASWEPPTDDGGDAITGYLVEWDTANAFNSGSLSPHKGTTTVSATDRSFTVTTLSASTSYYVRVFAMNSAGAGTAQTTTPSNAMPSLQVPGTPHTLTAVAGGSAGRIDVTWVRPRVPHHGFPCSGTAAAPNDCATPFGGTYPASDGGSDISGYEVEWNEARNFLGSDGSVTTIAGTSSTTTLTGLVTGRIYYIRIASTNAQGTGAFCELSGTDICDGVYVTAIAP